MPEESQLGVNIVSWGKSSTLETVTNKTSLCSNRSTTTSLSEGSRCRKNLNRKKTGNKRCFVIKHEEDTYEEIESFPSIITGSYTNDYNILWVHQIMLSYFDSLKKKLPAIRAKLEFQQLLYEKTLVHIEKRPIKKNIDKYTKDIINIEDGFKKKEYINRTSELLDMYSNNCPDHMVVYFGKTQDDIVEEPERLEVRLIIISDYLAVVSDYYEVNVHRVKTRGSVCPICYSNIEEVGIIDDGVLECICGYETDLYTKESMYKDTGRVESGRLDGNYQDRENFEKAIKKFQGIQEDVLPENLIPILDEWLVSYSFDPAVEIRNMPVNPDGSRGETSRELLFTALNSTGYSEYYKDERLILYKLWGWPKPDIAHLVDKLMADYDLTQPAYVTIEKDRKSSLNVQYRLFRHTQANGCHWTIDDFRVVETQDILTSHDKLWTIMCRKTGYPLILRHR